MAERPDYLRLHIETVHPIEVGELTSALDAYGHRYQDFILKEGLAPKGADARLLVSSVSQGSIDITFLPELAAIGMTMLPIAEPATLVVKFADQLLNLLEHFKGETVANSSLSVTTRDCDDVLNIVSPVAENGGNQTINVYRGDVIHNSYTITQPEAKRMRVSAERQRDALAKPLVETRQSVPMTWHQLAKDAPKTSGKRSPDQGIIEEIDKDAHSVLFTDDTAHLKDELIGDGENPYRKVYFVDVEVSRVADRVVSYRVCGFHGKEDLAA